MAIIFHDPTFPARLPSRQETLDFDITTDPDNFVVSLRYPSGYMETIYQAGLWGQFYLGSERVGSTFHIRRNAGWPLGRFSLPMSETSLSAGGLSWGTIYEVDLTAQDAQSMNAAASYTIDGHTWWAKGALANVGESNVLTPGLGLGILQPAALSAGTNWRGGGDVLYADRLLSFALAQLADYNPLAPVAVLASVAGPYIVSAEPVLYAGLANAASSAAALTSLEKATAVTAALDSQVNGGFYGTPHNTSSAAQYPISLSPALPSSTDQAGGVVGVIRFGEKRFFPLAGNQVTGPTENADSYNKFAVSSSTYVRSGNGISNSPSFIMLATRGANNASGSANYLTRLKIMQPKV